MSVPTLRAGAALASSAQEPTRPSGDGAEATPERISELADLLLGRIQHSIADISEINLQARLLSMNAQIEAGRAGDAGRSFGVVGREMVGLSERTQQAARTIESESETLVRELASISRALATHVRGTRLADLAHTNIDLIDRNLYERSCDCRWWATDAAMVAALEDADSSARDYASHRLGVILKSYTVYFDIVLADRAGRVIANGRPQQYGSVGQDVTSALWFKHAMATSTGEDFGFQGVHRSLLVGNERVLIYSCKVCRGGDAGAEPLGVLGVVFNWDGLAQKVVNDTPIEVSRRSKSQVAIVDDTGVVLATCGQSFGSDRLELPNLRELLSKPKAATILELRGGRVLAAHAQSPGFETYRSGWHSLILERLDR